MPMYGVVFSFTAPFDTKDMRTTAGGDAAYDSWRVTRSGGVRAECDAVCAAFSNATPPTIRTALTISRPQNREPNAPNLLAHYFYLLGTTGGTASRCNKRRNAGFRGMGREIRTSSTRARSIWLSPLLGGLCFAIGCGPGEALLGQRGISDAAGRS